MKPNNLIAVFIAVILLVIGVVLWIMSERSSNIPEQETGMFFGADTLNQVALIHADIGAPAFEPGVKSELDKIRESIDWSDAPSPAPELVNTDDYDVYINVSKEYLTYVFDKLGYTGEKIDSGETTTIPPLLVVSISKGWSDGETVQFKKVFFTVSFLHWYCMKTKLCCGNGRNCCPLSKHVMTAPFQASNRAH